MVSTIYFCFGSNPVDLGGYFMIGTENSPSLQRASSLQGDIDKFTVMYSTRQSTASAMERGGGILVCGVPGGGEGTD